MKKIVVTCVTLALGLALGAAPSAHAQDADGPASAQSMGLELANALLEATGEEGPGFVVQVESLIGPGGSQLWAEDPATGSLGVVFPGFGVDPDIWSADDFTGLDLPVIDYGDGVSITFNNWDYGWNGDIYCLPGQTEGCIPEWCRYASPCCPATTAYCVPPDVLMRIDVMDASLTAAQREGLWRFVSGTTILGLGCLTGAGGCDLLGEAATSAALEACLADTSACFNYATDYDWRRDETIEFGSFGFGSISGGG